MKHYYKITTIRQFVLPDPVDHKFDADVWTNKYHSPAPGKICNHTGLISWGHSALKKNKM